MGDFIENKKEYIEYFNEYFDSIKKAYKEGTEYTFRTALENLFNAVKPEKSLNVYQEPKKKKGDEGKPDFKVFKNGLLVGYVETKPIGMNLEEIIDKNSESRETKQLYTYLTVSPTLILSNYTDFVLFQNGTKVKTISLFDIRDKTLDANKISEISELFSLFFLTKPQEVKSPESLSVLLANRTKIFRSFVNEVLESNKSSAFKERLVGTGGLYELFKETLIEDLKLDEFADAYAQTITFGLLLARLNSTSTIDEKTALNFIPKSIGALRELFDTIDIEEIPEDISWIISAIIDILNSVDKKRFDEILSFKKTYDYEDPYVYFYEKFLAEYDKTKRKAKGVYYTPIPVVWFIIKSINKLLKNNFKVDGLKDSEVTVLDFATGTGTFLLEAFKNAIEETDEGSRPRLIKEHLLKNFYGFEYLIAPYAIAHLKLSQFMKDNSYQLEDNERINVYLTNTLDNDIHKRYALFPKISSEGTEAYEIKQKKPILVVMGNPPYSNFSRNKGWIDDLIKTYKEGLEERKTNLDDDYIKFLRYAQWKIEQTGKGIIGVITNNSYLDGITHREMRHKLLQTFDKIYILNLHGNKRKGETDKNVFDIKVGVAIALFVKLEKPTKEKEVYYFSITEDGKATTREEKYKFLLDNEYSKLDWTTLNSKAPNYWFVRKNETVPRGYGDAISIVDIFKQYNSGIQTKRDTITIRNSPEELIIVLTDLINLENEEFREKYRLPQDGRDWAIAKVKQDIIEDIQTIIQKKIKTATEITSQDWEEIKKARIFRILYRPFDIKYTYFFNKSRSFVAYPRYEIMKHLIGKENIALTFSRSWDVKNQWSGVSISENLVDIHYIGSQTYVAPLYLSEIKKENQKQISKDNSNEKSIEKKYATCNFTNSFDKFISGKYSFAPEPTEIFSYIYAILNSPMYREKYFEQLKTAYPKIPFVDDNTTFKKLSSLGQKLIDLHLLKIGKIDAKVAEFKEKGGDRIEKLSYDSKTNRVYINKTQYFDNISEPIWNFEIGGYQVLHKWLSGRKGTILSYEGQMQFKKIVYSLSETIKIMEEIDKVYTKLD
ncbi:MAG: type ISP restriction/modification enzyme [Candidatus Micrarchaeaceae archaeon]